MDGFGAPMVRVIRDRRVAQQEYHYRAHQYQSRHGRYNLAPCYFLTMVHHVVRHG
jgi:membrane protein DedA with SNARE-associated domain